MLLNGSHLAISKRAIEGRRYIRTHVGDFIQHPLGVPHSPPEVIPQRRAHTDVNVLQGAVQNPCRTLHRLEAVLTVL